MDRKLTDEECTWIVTKTICDLDNHIPDDITQLDLARIYSEIVRILYHDLDLYIKELN